MNSYQTKAAIERDREVEQQARKGWTNESKCVCGSNWKWDITTDGFTGSTVVFCKSCGRCYPTQTAYIDYTMGMHVGSWWSQAIAENFIIWGVDDPRHND